MALAYAPAITPRRCRADQQAGPSLRLTRRGRLAIVALAALALLVLGPWRAMAGAPAGTIPTGWTTVTVAPGDTLWGIAEATDPGADPRALIAEIKEANHLPASELTPGQQLAVPIH